MGGRPADWPVTQSDHELPAVTQPKVSAEMAQEKQVETAAKSATAVAKADETASQLMAYLKREAAAQKAAGGLAYEIAKSQIQRMMEAEEDDEIWESDAVIDPDTRSLQMRDLDGLSIEIPDQDFRIVESSEEFEASLDHYIQFRCMALSEDKNLAITKGTELLVSTGAALAIAKILRFRSLNKMPIRCTIQKVENTKGVIRLAKYTG